jgi:hypothetical protein
MRRIWLLVLSIAVLAGGAVLLYKNKRDPHTSFNRAESNFRIENTMTIGRIILTQKSGSRADLKRVGDHWTVNDTHKARQSTVDLLLTGIERQNLYHIPNKAAN